MAIKIQENENQHLAYSEQRSSDQEQQQQELQLQLLDTQQLHTVIGGNSTHIISGPSMLHDIYFELRLNPFN